MSLCLKHPTLDGDPVKQALVPPVSGEILGCEEISAGVGVSGRGERAALVDVNTWDVTSGDFRVAGDGAPVFIASWNS